MATSWDDEEDFATIGSAFEVPDEASSSKKPFNVHEQIVVDDKGRRRFHGAFTGGFSAGYFNSVGTKEGWSPSTFVSSRANRQNKDALQRPEDFMDDEDFGEYGIAPKKFMTKDSFTPRDKETSSLKRNLDQAVREGALKSAVPGGLPVDGLIIASKLSIGVVLLRKMGWKEGQGIGDKIKSVGLASNANEARKIYGCSLPTTSATGPDLDVHNLRLFLAPKDVQPICFDAKNNTHGIGYSGIDPNRAMFLGAGSLAETFKPSGSEKRGIKGQAFGVGAFEDEDADIDGKDTMSNYDFSMASEAEIDRYANHGWSGPAKKDKQKGVVPGFKKASKPTAINKVFPAPTLPLNYIPRHNPKPSTPGSTVPKSDRSGFSNRSFLSANDRAVLLGEKEPKRVVESVFDMISDKDKDRISAAKQSTGKTLETFEDAKKLQGEGEIQPEKPRRSSRWDSKVKHSIAYVSKRVEGDSFKPFASDPEKQQRYDEFLTTQKLGKKPEIVHKTSMTEWEKEREKEEFSRASILFRPMSSAIASRFTRATEGNASTENTSKKEPVSDKSDCEKAASLGLFGKLTRETYDWHPHAVLCKRFNVPDPYPGSRITGVPGNERKKTGWLHDFDTDIYEKDTGYFEPTEVTHRPDKEPISKQTEGNKSIAQVETERDKFKKKSSEEDSLSLRPPMLRNKEKSIKIGPLSYLNDVPAKQDSEEKAGSSKPDRDKQSHTEEDAEKPSIDLFKAIFADSGESSDEDDEDLEQKSEGDKEMPEERLLEESESSLNVVKNNDLLKGADDVVMAGANETSSNEKANFSPRFDAVNESNSSSKSLTFVQPENAVARESLIFGPALPGEKMTSQQSRHYKVSPSDLDLYKEKSSKKHKKDKDKHKKHKHKKKHSKQSSDKSSKYKLDQSESDSNDSDQDVNDSVSGARSRSNHNDHVESNRSKNHASEPRSELREKQSKNHKSQKRKSRKHKRKHKRHVSSEDSSDSEGQSVIQSKNAEENKNLKIQKKSDDIPSARTLVEKMKKHGLVVKRMSAADFM